MSEDKCPFCGAEEVKPKVCPTCYHVEGYTFGDQFACGTVKTEDDNMTEWFRHALCYETQLARKDALLESILERTRRHDSGLWLVRWQGNLLDDITAALVPRLRRELGEK